MLKKWLRPQGTGSTLRYPTCQRTFQHSRLRCAKTAEMWLTRPVPEYSAKCFNLAAHLLRSHFSQEGTGRTFNICVKMWIKHRLLLASVGYTCAFLLYSSYFVVLASSCSFAQTQKIVKRVVIYSYAGGLGGGFNTLQRRGSKYLLNGQPVSTVQV